MRGKNQEEKQQEIQTHKQERSTWHVSILPAISIIREGQWNFEILWGRKISHCEKVFANSFWNTTSAIVAGLELVQDKSAWRKGRLHMLLLSKLSSHIWLLSIIFAEWDTSDISLVKYQLYTSTNFQFLCSSTVWICAHCQQDLRSVYTVHRITTRFLVNKVNCYRLWTAPIQFIWMPRRKKYNAKRQTNKQPQTFSSQKLDICWKWFYFINLGNISSHVFREDPNVQRLIWVICNFVESVSHIQIWQLALL